MTDEELIAEVKRHWEHWAFHTGVQNWRPAFFVCPKADMSGAMSVDWETPYLKVSVFINRDYWQDDDVKHAMETDVLHEQLHLVAHRLTEFGKEEMGRDASRSVLWRLFADAHEHSIDAVTSVIWRLHEQTGCGQPQWVDMMTEERAELRETFTRWGNGAHV